MPCEFNTFRDPSPRILFVSSARRSAVAVLGMVLIFLVFSQQAYAAKPSRAKRIATEEGFKSAFLPVVRKYCIECHGKRKNEHVAKYHINISSFYRDLGPKSISRYFMLFEPRLLNKREKKGWEIPRPVRSRRRQSRLARRSRPT